MIRRCQQIWKRVGLDLYVYPYKVLPLVNGSDGRPGGVIECVPNASTRDEIGKAYKCSLKNWFISKFGDPLSLSFQRAQRYDMI